MKTRKHENTYVYIHNNKSNIELGMNSIISRDSKVAKMKTYFSSGNSFVLVYLKYPVL